MAAAGEGEALTRRGIPLDPQLRVLAIGAFATRFGSGAVMTTSALLRNGVGHLQTLITQTKEWMERRNYDSIAQMKGSMSQLKVADPSAFERANYIQIVKSYAPTFH